jgi:hypothetical protein
LLQELRVFRGHFVVDETVSVFLSRRRIKVAGYSGCGEDPGKLGKRVRNKPQLIIKFQRATGGKKNRSSFSADMNFV